LTRSRALHRRRGRVVAVTALTLLAVVVPARAEDYVVIRGAYYREPSTRVIQPMIEIERDSPSGLDVGAHFLVDTITSASVAAGTAIDNVFTETRNEAGLRVRKRWQRDDLSLGYRYSAESDYWSHALGASGGHRFWGDTATVRLSLGLSLDTMTTRGRIPPCALGTSSIDCHLRVWFVGGSYTQVLSPVALAQISAEFAYLDGFQGNLYRGVPTYGLEVLPETRLRSAIAPRVAYYIPRTGTGLQLHYRYYWDMYPGGEGNPWALRAHTIEARVYQQVSRDVELRFSYRQHFQNHAQFWCDGTLRPCSPPFYSNDPKLGPVHTEYPELKVVWETEALRDIAYLRWFAGGSLEVSYGYYIQNSSFGNAHVLQMGYRMPY
jgi:hypothetical protein